MAELTYIYVVDDDEEARDGTVMWLDTCFEMVIPCSSPAEFFDKFSTAEPSVVLTDVRMHGMTGFELQAKVNKRDPEIPVIIFTAQAKMEHGIEAVRGGKAWHYLQKPVDPNDLIQIMTEAKAYALKTFPIRQARDVLRERIATFHVQRL